MCFGLKSLTILTYSKISEGFNVNFLGFGRIFQRVNGKNPDFIKYKDFYCSFIEEFLGEIPLMGM
jgi:hypothetical protein